MHDYNVTTERFSRKNPQVVKERVPREPHEDTRYVYPMAVVEKMTNLTRRRIRYYEKRGLLNPGRTEGGHRLYSPTNVETLIRIRDIIDSGITNIEAVGRMIALDLDRPASERSSAPRKNPASIGDAAMRVMRPVETQQLNPKARESDSLSHFRRK